MFNEFKDEIKERNADAEPKNSDKTITVKLLLKDCIYGLEGSNLESELMTEILNEWAKGAFPTYTENINYDISVFTSTDKLKEIVSSYLYLKSSEYDIMMLNIAWPLFTDYGIMLYRKDLLEKYKKEVPKTWDQLEETVLDILKEEHKNGNKNLDGYAGQFASNNNNNE
ncbi:hypothetical protein PIROE2DRAFT_57498 [Piromyces sp. E2]|nr:hypothetical protein PIROE2DRAFT_57498 [Piromyces sp. E2]|eukprot:OUM69280.1 hypothetical protein PIROE2DRAFT_57498 [Piromyces sp. E2]